MSSVLTITEEIKTLAQLERHLGIRLADDADFFQEWLGAREAIYFTIPHFCNYCCQLMLECGIGEF
jgi:hypothetical protein